METNNQSTERSLQIRQAMQAHVQSRLRQILSKFEGKKADAAIRQRIKDAEEKYQLELILEKGANAASQIAVASHIAKGVHPDLNARKVSNLAVNFSELPELEMLGSHVLDTKASLMDTTGNGSYNSAAYELYLLLDCRFEEKTLGHLLEVQDVDALAAFQMGQQNAGFAAQCLSLLESKCPRPSVHALNKQIYWLLPDAEPADDGSFELLTPLFPASLAHAVYGEIQEHRFGEANKAARIARRERKPHDGVFHDYPGLAAQKMGGTKPQNISQLNSERSGVNYLLSSLPPAWTSSAVRLPVKTASVFDRMFIARPGVRRTVRALRKFLASEPESNKATREHRDSLVDALVDELVSMAGELQQLMQPGWSKDDERFAELDLNEQLWLDPLRAEKSEEVDFARKWLQMDWPAEIGKNFALWLNHQLKGQLPVGDAEVREWSKVLLTDEDGFKQQLRELRDKLDVLHYIPNRKTHDELVAERGESV